MTASGESLTYLRELVYRRSAIVLPPDKHYLIDSRLQAVAREAGVASIDELVSKMRREQGAAPLAKRVVEAMTTNETLFFRDFHPFEALKTRFVPQLMRARQKQRQLRIWCAAASTGQEPYSIAMTLREAFPELASWDVRILATDINASVLERAQAATYRPHEVNRGMSPELLARYFDPVGPDFRLKPEIREMVKFAELNLLDAWTTIGPQDIVFIRNVLIYFDVETKRQLLGRIRKLLEVDGYLVLGGAETTNNLDDGYTSLKVGGGVYYQVKP